MKAGHGPRPLQRAGGVDAEELEVAADVAQAAIGGRLAARVERPHDHLVAGLETLDSVTDLGDRPRHLVPDHLRWPHPRVHRAVRDVQIGAADAAVGDLEPHLSRSRRADVAGPDGEHAGALVVDGTHRVVGRHNKII